MLQLVSGIIPAGAEPGKKIPDLLPHRQTAQANAEQAANTHKILLKGKHITSMTELLNQTGQIINTFVRGFNNLINSDLHRMESLGLLFGISAAIAWFKQLIKHRW